MHTYTQIPPLTGIFNFLSFSSSFITLAKKLLLRSDVQARTCLCLTPKGNNKRPLAGWDALITILTCPAQTVLHTDCAFRE